MSPWRPKLHPSFLRSSSGRPSGQHSLRQKGRLESVELSPTDAINIQYTSGTTGFPKGATLSHTNILVNGYLTGLGCGYSAQDRICLPVPLYHCFGMVLGSLAALTHGACIVLPAPSFEPASTLQAVADERCTSLYGVPTMFIAELDLPTSIATTSPACEQESWRDRHARSRS